MNHSFGMISHIPCPGLSKVEAARDTLAFINPDVDIQVEMLFYNINPIFFVITVGPRFNGTLGGKGFVR